jgi:peptidoglycan lytic transglycosylase G
LPPSPISGPLPQVPAAGWQGVPTDPYQWQGDPRQPDYPGTGGTVPGGTVSGGTVSGGTVSGGTVSGGTVSGGTVSGGTVPGGTVPGGPARPGRPGPPDISGPMPATPWGGHPATSQPMPAVPADPLLFADRGGDSGYQRDYADEDEPYGDEDLDRPYGRDDQDDDGFARAEGRGRPGGRGPGRPRRRGRRLSAPLIALLVLAVFLSAGGVVGYRFLRQYVIPPDYSGSGYSTVVVEVKQDQTATDVARTLFGLGVVASERAFVKAAEQSSQQRAIEPGFYRLHKHMQALLAFDMLLNPSSRVQIKISIPEGLRENQIIATLAAKSGIPVTDYRAALANPAALGLPSYANNRAEGYLFPATYPVQPKMTAAGVLRAMVAQFNAEATRIDLVATAHRVNLTPAEAIIVASLVQAEGGRISDYPKIARVIYNRLDSNMLLQLDSTVMYALNTYGILATNQQLQTPSPYNTYVHVGLPPGPIDSPGDAAINAALHPAQGNWLYFVTVNPKTGLTEFTASASEFAKLRAELQQNLGNSG